MCKTSSLTCRGSQLADNCEGMGYPDDVLIGAVIGMYIMHVLHVSFNVHHDIIIMRCEAHFEGDVCNVCEH